MSAVAMDNRFGIEVPVTQPLSLEWMKRVMAEHVRYVGDALNAPMLEQFGEKLRASANCVVGFVGKSFAVVNWVVDAGKNMVTEFARGRGRAAGAKAPSFRKPSVKPTTPGGAGPNGAR